MHVAGRSCCFLKTSVAKSGLVLTTDPGTVVNGGSTLIEIPSRAWSRKRREDATFLSNTLSSHSKERGKESARARQSVCEKEREGVERVWRERKYLCKSERKGTGALAAVIDRTIASNKSLHPPPRQGEGHTTTIHLAAPAACPPNTHPPARTPARLPCAVCDNQRTFEP